jgi:hypothetical protein
MVRLDVCFIEAARVVVHEGPRAHASRSRSDRLTLPEAASRRC